MGRRRPMKNDLDKEPLDKDDEDTGEEDKEGGESGGSVLPLGMCFGSAAGLLGMTLTGEIFWLTIGVAVGTMLGLAWDGMKKHDKKDK